MLEQRLEIKKEDREIPNLTALKVIPGSGIAFQNSSDIKTEIEEGGIVYELLNRVKINPDGTVDSGKKLEEYVRRWKWIGKNGVKLIFNINPYHRNYLSVYAADIERAEGLYGEASLFGSYSLYDVSLSQLTNSNIPDKCIHVIWIDFVSKCGKSYIAINIFNYSKGPQYVRLMSGYKDGDWDKDDFIKVSQLIKEAYGGYYDGDICNRGRDLVQDIDLREPLTQQYVAEKVKRFYQRKFKNVKISDVSWQDLEA